MLAEMIESEARHRKNNNGVAPRLFKDVGCIFEDGRTITIVQNTISILAKAFAKKDGKPKLTAIAIAIGDDALNILGYESGVVNKGDVIKVGDFILDAFDKMGLVILTREDYLTSTMVSIWVKELDKGGNPTYIPKKKKITVSPWIIEIGPEFKTVVMSTKERTGLSLKPYPRFHKGGRVINGVYQRLSKSYADVAEISNETVFIQAIDKIESVKWAVDARVAAVSYALKDELTDTMITLFDGSGKPYTFDASDIYRTAGNEHLVGVDLYLPEASKMFEPEMGNAAKVDFLKLEVKRLTKLGKEARTPKAKAKSERKVELTTVVLEKHVLWWQDKQYCLRLASKASRNREIINTIHGTDDVPGWAGYVFYMAMFSDYRGRLYNVDSYFSFQSNDITKGHLKFAESKVVDERGAYWMYIHSANSFNQSYDIDVVEAEGFEADYVSYLNKQELDDISVDKMTLADRAKWTEDHILEMIEVADDPLTNTWWKQAEKPYVFLQMCFEVAGLFFAEQDGEDYWSHSIISVDGANNGTQHLAAMSRDEEAGALVGLTPREIPLDFYVLIMQRMINNNKIKTIAEKLMQIPMKMKRKGISKRGTMTRAYDAGKKCIAKIIYQDSYDCGIVAKYGLTEADSLVLSGLLMKAYKQTCFGPVRIKEYLQALVIHRLSKQKALDVEWETPSGFPVVTRKRVCYDKHSKGTINGKRINHVYREEKEIPLTSEHLSAIGANWVHSYDASHLSFTVVEMSHTNVAVVHDSFGTHACDVNDLLEATKRTFIAMYQEDALERMKKEITGGETPLDKEGNEIHPPKLGSLDLEEIWLSDFFFC